jgi:hypothetical protein
MNPLTCPTGTLSLSEREGVRGCPEFMERERERGF